MTKKQKKCIEWICDVLGVDYTGGDNKEDAYWFILRYMQKAKKEQKRIRRNRILNNSSRRVYYSENSYSGPYGTDIVDCYDYGICPWGNS